MCSTVKTLQLAKRSNTCHLKIRHINILIGIISKACQKCTSRHFSQSAKDKQHFATIQYIKLQYISKYYAPLVACAALAFFHKPSGTASVNCGTSANLQVLPTHTQKVIIPNWLEWMILYGNTMHCYKVWQKMHTQIWTNHSPFLLIISFNTPILSVLSKASKSIDRSRTLQFNSPTLQKKSSSIYCLVIDQLDLSEVIQREDLHTYNQQLH